MASGIASDNGLLLAAMVFREYLETPEGVSTLKRVIVKDGIVKEGEFGKFEVALRLALKDERNLQNLPPRVARAARGMDEPAMNVECDAIRPETVGVATDLQGATIPMHWRASVESHLDTEGSVSESSDDPSSSVPSTAIEDLPTIEPLIAAPPVAVPISNSGNATPSRKRRRVPIYKSPHRVSHEEMDELYSSSQLAFDGKGWPCKPASVSIWSFREHFGSHEDAARPEDEVIDVVGETLSTSPVPPRVLTDSNIPAASNDRVKFSGGAPAPSRKSKSKAPPKPDSDSSNPDASKVLGKRKQPNSPSEENKLRRSSRERKSAGKFSADTHPTRSSGGRRKGVSRKTLRQ